MTKNAQNSQMQKKWLDRVHLINNMAELTERTALRKITNKKMIVKRVCRAWPSRWKLVSFVWILKQWRIISEKNWISVDLEIGL